MLVVKMVEWVNVYGKFFLAKLNCFSLKNERQYHENVYENLCNIFYIILVLSLHYKTGLDIITVGKDSFRYTHIL